MSAEQGSDSGENRTPGTDKSIGARLVAAREARKLGIEKVAADLRLDVAVIRALENDDHAALPAPIFVQGYLRSYARLVGLPGQELVRDYTAGRKELPPLSVKRLRRRPARLHQINVTMLRNILLALLLVVVIWLAWPFAAQLVKLQHEPEDVDRPGRLELPLPGDPAGNGMMNQ